MRQYVATSTLSTKYQEGVIHLIVLETKQGGSVCSTDYTKDLAFALVELKLSGKRG